MGERKNPFKEIGYSNYLGPHFMPMQLKERAENHEMHRQRVISMILLDLYLMATKKIIPVGSMVSAHQAISQSLSGSEKDKSQAAHCAPRQIIIGTQSPQELLYISFPERGFALDALFGETDILPANFNRADSRAERNGLAEGFRNACLTVITDAHIKGKMDSQTASVAVRAAYSGYEVRAHEAFQISIDRLKNKLKIKQTPSDERKWQEQLAITQTYYDVLLRSTGPNEVLDFNRVEGLIRVYNMI